MTVVRDRNRSPVPDNARCTLCKGALWGPFVRHGAGRYVCLNCCSDLADDVRTALALWRDYRLREKAIHDAQRAEPGSPTLCSVQ